MLDALFRPMTIREKTIKNRLVVPAMVCNYCTRDGYATEQYIAYHEAKAKGGWGLIITEDYAVSPEGRGYANVAGLWEDGQIAGHAELPRRVHAHGSIVLAQIFHAGRATSRAVIGTTPVAPSAVPGRSAADLPRALTEDEIHRIVVQFSDTAYRAKQCGFDGVEIHGAHGYLINQFLSPYTNKRTDLYGGSFLNRLRFALEIIRLVRQRCGEDFIISFRISGEELVTGGRDLEDTKAIVPYLEDAGVDLVNVSVGVDDSGMNIIPSAYTDHAWLVNHAQEIRNICHIPVITVGRINDPILANSVLHSGKADFVAMGRASLADPELPNKALRGEYNAIRKCIGCDKGCIGQLKQQHGISCVLNPTLGHESEPAKPAGTKKRVVVIGGGPGGLSAAITAAENGHHVTVLEKEPTAGGQFRIAAVPPAKSELTDFIAWQLDQCSRLGVQLRCGTEATVDLLRELDADEVILATGATPIMPPIPGAHLPHVVSVNDVLSGNAAVGQQVVIVGGGSVGAEAANFLRSPARSVTVVEMRSSVAEDEFATVRVALLEQLRQKEVALLTDTAVQEIGEHSVKVRRGDTVSELPCDSVIIAVGSRPLNTLQKPLEDAGFHVQVVGDAEGVGLVMKAVHQGYYAAQNI